MFDVTDVLFLGVLGYLFDDGLDLLELQIDDIVHDAHRGRDVAPELAEVERRLFRERLVYIAVQIDRQQAAAVIRAERNFAAGIRRDRPEAQIGVAVGNGLAQDRVPEQNAGFGRLPCVVDDLVP